MPDYSKYTAEKLWEMLDTAFSDYYKRATRPCGDGNKFLASPEAEELRQATERYEAICEELVRRGQFYEHYRLPQIPFGRIMEV